MRTTSLIFALFLCGCPDGMLFGDDAGNQGDVSVEDASRLEDGDAEEVTPDAASDGSAMDADLDASLDSNVDSNIDGDANISVDANVDGEVPDGDASGPVRNDWLSATGWTNVSFPEQSGTVTIAYDIRATVPMVDAVAGLSLGQASQYSELAMISRMNELGNLDMRDGDAYTASSVFPYAANTIYRITIEANLNTQRYTVRVQAPSGAPVLLRDNAMFRTEQQVSRIDHLSFFEKEDRFEVGNLVVNGTDIPMTVVVPPTPTGLWSVDFQNSPLGNYTDARLRADWEGVRWSSLEGRVSVESEANNKFIRVRYPQGVVGNGDGGAGWGIDFERFRNRTYNELYVSYRLRFRSGFDFVKGGKLPGLSGGANNTGGNKPNGSDGWSGRMMWRTDGDAVQYLYHPDQPSIYGEDLDWSQGGQRQFPTGQWITVEHHIVMNTPGQRNGIVEGWYNGQQALRRTNIRFRDNNSFEIDEFMFSTFFGGSGQDWAATRNEHIDFDDFIFSDRPITH